MHSTHLRAPSPRASTDRTTDRTAHRVAAGVAAGLAAVALTLAAPTIASAHVALDADPVAPGTVTDLAFTVGHGCDGSPTTAVTIAIPDEIGAVTPVAVAGWTIDYDLEGAGRTVTFTAETPLPSAVRDTLVLGVSVPDDVAEGTVLPFPAQQTCEVGSHAWDELDAGAESPAPMLTVAAAGSTSAETEAAAAASAPVDAVGVGTATPVAIAALIAAVAAAALATIALRRQSTARAERARDRAAR